MKKRKLSPAATAAVGLAITAVVAAAGWFLLVSPQRSRAAELADEIAAVELQVSEARRAQVAIGDAEPIKVADLFRLTKAMPDDNDMAGVLLELSQVAEETGIEFEQIIPQATVSAGTYRAQPIQLVFTGNFYELSDFLYRLRNLVSVQHGRLLANGRLFAVDKLEFVESEEDHFPNIKALLAVSAFLYGSGPVAGAAPVPAPAATTDTTSTATTATTTDTTTTEPAPSAAGTP